MGVSIILDTPFNIVDYFVKFATINQPKTEITMSTLESLKAKLKNGNIAEASRVTGISLATLYNIASGSNDNPRIKTVEALEDYFSNKVVDRSCP